MIFLIEYDRQRGRLVSFREFDEAGRLVADEARLELELELKRRGIEREVVLLEADTADALRQTHGRYFGDPGRLARRSRE